MDKIITYTIEVTDLFSPVFQMANQLTDMLTIKFDQLGLAIDTAVGDENKAKLDNLTISEGKFGTAVQYSEAALQSLNNLSILTMASSLETIRKHTVSIGEAADKTARKLGQLHIPALKEMSQVPAGKTSVSALDSAPAQPKSNRGKKVQVTNSVVVSPDLSKLSKTLTQISARVAKLSGQLKALGRISFKNLNTDCGAVNSKLNGLFKNTQKLKTSLSGLSKIKISKNKLSASADNSGESSGQTRGRDFSPKGKPKGFSLGSLGKLTSALNISPQKIIVDQLKGMFTNGMAMDKHELNLTSLLHGKGSADKMVGQIQQYAGKTSYSQNQLAGGAESLAKSGVKQSDIMPDLKAIGDVAGGESDKMSSLTAAFSKVMQTGNLTSDTFQQMNDAGFNPLQEMAQMTGQSLSSLKQQMDAGQISAKQISDTFRQATSAGGDFYGRMDAVSNTLEGAGMNAFNSFKNSMMELYQALSPVLIPALKILSVVLDTIVGAVSKVIKFFTDMSPLAMGLGIIIAGLTIAMIANSIAMQMQEAGGILAFIMTLTGLKDAETIAWIANAAAIMANPITWIVLGVIALIAGIAALVYKVDGWGKTWKNIMTVCGLVFTIFKASIMLAWDTIMDTIFTGIETLEKAWYKLKALFGDKDAQKHIIEIDEEQKERKAKITEDKKTITDTAKQISQQKVFELSVNDKSLLGGVKSALPSAPTLDMPKVPDVGPMLKGQTGKLDDATDTQKQTLGFAGINRDTQLIDKSGQSSDMGQAVSAAGTAKAIAGGGNKSSQITIKIGSLVQGMSIQAENIRESAIQIREIVEDELIRAIQGATVNA